MKSETVFEPSVEEHVHDNRDYDRSMTDVLFCFGWSKSMSTITGIMTYIKEVAFVCFCYVEEHVHDNRDYDENGIFIYTHSPYKVEEHVHDNRDYDSLLACASVSITSKSMSTITGIMTNIINLIK